MLFEKQTSKSCQPPTHPVIKNFCLHIIVLVMEQF
jgi:hypothetical protein